MLHISRRQTPNRMSRQGWKPDMIVSHVTEGVYQGAVSWLCNPRSNASAHYVVSRSGDVTQLVDLREAAWCNGTSVGGKYNVERSRIAAIRNRRTNANLYTVSIEHEGYSYKDLFGGLTEPQYKATLELHRHIIAEVKRIYGVTIPVDRSHIIGHFEVAPVEKPNCPGRNFPWERLIRDLLAKQGGGSMDAQIKVIYRGRPLTVQGYQRDGRTYVQLRELMEKTGHVVTWDAATKTIRVD